MYKHRYKNVWHETQPELINTASWVFLLFTMISGIDTLWTQEYMLPWIYTSSFFKVPGNKGLIPVL